MSLACILGCAGPVLGDEEASFFADADPWGFILFKRNIESADQVRALTGALRTCVGRADAPILVDQEGGRVQRFGPPNWPAMPAARRIGALAERDLDAGRETAWLSGRLIAADLLDVGVTVDCAPVADLPTRDAHAVIGDRAYGEDPVLVATLARAMAEGLIAGGVMPIVKHTPGHGRATADSHRGLPVVEAALADLQRQDFAPFAALSDLPAAMTAHVVYSAIDARRPATISPVVIARVIRGAIGFDGLLISDDLSMGALAGGLGERARASHAAGCDVVLHCNGDMKEMRAVTGATPPLSSRAEGRAAAALARLDAARPAWEARQGRDRLDALLVAP